MKMIKFNYLLLFLALFLYMSSLIAQQKQQIQQTTEEVETLFVKPPILPVLKSPQSQFKLGVKSLVDKEPQTKKENGIHFILQSANQGYSEAQDLLGSLYFKGNLIPQDHSVAHDWWLKAAKKQNPNAQNSLGYMYLTGNSVAKNEKEALFWFNLAAEQGHTIAQLNLGNMYLQGRVVEQDLTKACEWNEKAAEASKMAKITLGLCYYRGVGKKKNYNKAFKLWKDAAVAGDARAMHKLGMLYYLGHGVQQDFKKAYAWFFRSSQKENLEAYNELGVLSLKGQGVAMDTQKAKDFFTLAANNDISISQKNLGKLFLTNHKLQNIKKSMFWLKKSARQHDSDASYLLGLIFYNPIYKKQNFELAASWLRKAAYGGHAAAQNLLGKMYETELGVQTNWNAAKYWYTNGAYLGDQQSIKALEKISKKLFHSKITYTNTPRLVLPTKFNLVAKDLLITRIKKTELSGKDWEHWLRKRFSAVSHQLIFRDIGRETSFYNPFYQNSVYKFDSMDHTQPEEFQFPEKDLLKSSTTDLSEAKWEQWLTKSSIIPYQQLIITDIGEDISPHNPLYRSLSYKSLPIEQTLPFLIQLFYLQTHQAYRQRIARMIADLTNFRNLDEEQLIEKAAVRLKLSGLMLELLSDQDPVIRYWILTAVARQAIILPESILEKLVNDSSVRVQQAAFSNLLRLCNTKHIPFLKKIIQSKPFYEAEIGRAISYLLQDPQSSADSATLKLKSWLAICISTAVKGSILERAGALRAIRDLALTNSLELLEILVKSPLQERSVLEYALMQVPDLIIYISTFRMHNTALHKKGENAIKHLEALHLGWNAYMNYQSGYSYKRIEWPLTLDQNDKTLIRFVNADSHKYQYYIENINDQSFYYNKLSFPSGRYKFIIPPLLVLVFQERGNIGSDLVYQYDRKAALALLIHEVQNFPSANELWDFNISKSSKKQLQLELYHPLLLEAAQNVMQWVMDGNYYYRYPEIEIIWYIARWGGSKQKKEVFNYILGLSDRKLGSLNRQKKLSSAVDLLDSTIPVKVPNKLATTYRVPSMWYKECTRRVTDPNLAVASGAVNCLLLSDEEGAIALLTRIFHMEEGNSDLSVLNALAVIHGYTKEVLPRFMKEIPRRLSETNQRKWLLLKNAIKKKTEVIRDISDLGFRGSYSAYEKKAKHQRVKNHSP